MAHLSFVQSYPMLLLKSSKRLYEISCTSIYAILVTRKLLSYTVKYFSEGIVMLISLL